MAAPAELEAVILAAGVGRRLGRDHELPKCLLRLGGRTLLDRHLENLMRIGATRVTICVGYARDQIDAALTEADWDAVQTVENPEYRLGSMVSLWTCRSALRRGRDVILMDADVLYDRRMLERLGARGGCSVMLMDRDLEDGDEPVKICLAEERIVEFRKIVSPTLTFDDCGESVGFFRLEHRTAERLADRTEAYLDAGDRDAPYEEALRDVALADAAAFQVEDVTGIPWIEIDFPEDLARAERDVLPRLEESGDAGQ